MSKRGWVLFIAMGIVWGIPYLLIKVAVEEVSPATLVFLRTGLAALLLLPLAAAKGYLRPVIARWRVILVFAAIEIAIPWLLLNNAERTLSSSLSGLLIASVPLIGAILGWLSGQEKLGSRRILGLLVGILGVGAIVGFNVSGANLPALAQMAVVAIGYATGPFIISRYLSDLPGIGVIAAALTVTALVYIPVGIAQFPSTMPSANAIGAILVLALICTALAFILFFALIEEIGPVRSTVITYVNPAVAIVLGVAFLGEPLTLAICIGFVLVLIGSILATRRSPAPPSAQDRDGELEEPLPAVRVGEKSRSHSGIEAA